MDAFKVLGKELSKFKENKGVLFSVIGVLLIPLVYAAILLSAKWGPYDHLDNLPVAFVNNDAGAVSDGKEINAGNELVAELKESFGMELCNDGRSKKRYERSKVLYDD